jgi:hypothetical protein
MTDLREKVARAIQDVHVPGHPLNRLALYQADAAISLVVEACAEVAESDTAHKKLLPLCTDGENLAAVTGQVEAADRIAAAIRKLGEKK